MTEVKVTIVEDISKRQQRINLAAMRTLNISRSAESLSRHSNPVDYYFDLEQPSSAFQAIAAYGAILAMSNDNFYLTERFVKKLASRAYFQNYEGHWALLQDFLEQSTTTVEFEKLAREWFTPQVFFGNLLKAIARLMGTVKAKRTDPQRSSAPVRKRVRRRGYRDKGTLRSVESRIRAAANTLLAVVEEYPRRVDRRYSVKHPLLHKEASTEIEVESLAALSALEELYEAAEAYLRKEGETDGNLYKSGNRGYRRIQEILEPLIRELKERIERNQSPDLRTQEEESRTGNETS